MDGLQSFQLLLTQKTPPTKVFLTRQQLIEKNKKEKAQLQSSRIQNKKISKPQSVMKISTSKMSTQKISQQKKTFSCSKFQVNELVPDYTLICKNQNKTHQSSTTLNTDYFNFVSKKCQSQNIDNSNFTEYSHFQQMKNELLKSFLDIEQMLHRKAN